MWPLRMTFVYVVTKSNGYDVDEGKTVLICTEDSFVSLMNEYLKSNECLKSDEYFETISYTINKVPLNKIVSIGIYEDFSFIHSRDEVFPISNENCIFFGPNIREYIDLVSSKIFTLHEKCLVDLEEFYSEEDSKEDSEEDIEFYKSEMKEFDDFSFESNAKKRYIGLQQKLKQKI